MSGQLVLGSGGRCGGVMCTSCLSGGEFAQGELILNIAAIEPLDVQLTLPMGRYGNINPGSKGTISPKLPSDGEYEVAVVIIDKSLDAESGAFGVRFVIPNGNLVLPAGVECEVKFKEALY